MFKAWDRLRHKVIIGTWSEVCDLDKRNWEITEYFGEEVIPKKPLVTFNVRTQKGGIRKLEVFNDNDLEGIYIGDSSARC